MLNILSFSDTAEKVVPSVIHVNIVDKKDQLTPEGWDFSYNPFSPSPGNIFEDKREYFDEGLGSAVIIKKTGNRYYAVTNRHVISDADKITVKMYDGEYSEAFLAGYDERKDIAVIYFDTDNPSLKVIKMGNSDLLKVGDWVLAVGSPFGFESTVTSGIVSALGRKNSAGGNISDFIQTDTSINTGNSGGALVNMKGELVGINSWITTTTGGSIGLGFAIPVNNIKKSVEDIINHGEVRYGWIGIIAGEIAEHEKKIFDVEGKKGVMVFQTIEEAPAEQNGILPGDFIMKVNGREISNIDSLLFNVGEAGDGRITEFVIKRDNNILTKNIELGLRGKKENLSTMENKYWPGISIVTLDNRYLNIAGLDKYDYGVLVTYSEKNAIMETLKPGDIIYEINDITVKNARDFFVIINKNKQENKIKYTRNGIEYTDIFKYPGTDR